MKFWAILLAVLVSSSVFAGDETSVVERVTCADIKASISELSAIEEPDEDTIDELTKLKADYRRSCSRTARGRRTTASSRVVVEADDTEKKSEDVNVDDDEDVAVEEEKVEKKPTKKKTGDNKVEKEPIVDEVEDDAAEELSEDEILEQELMNLDAGLCADGSKPNKYGCCSGELFKDLGNAVFACCPKEGGDCFPPIK
ncbi:MAG: hypothetical protein II208_00560 [Alphaproteobacteria bacterium]|nr:hypothetical protein [Alphaproteobacteria bacterium]